MALEIREDLRIRRFKVFSDSRFVGHITNEHSFGGSFAFACNAGVMSDFEHDEIKKKVAELNKEAKL
jgi:hypothetical protein